MLRVPNAAALEALGFTVQGDRAFKSAAPAKTPSPGPLPADRGWVLSLDMATNCGWAVGNGERIESGVIDLGQGLDELGGDAKHATMFKRFADWLEGWLARAPLSLVAFEDNGSFLRGQAARTALGLRAVVMLVCMRAGVRSIAVTASSWKRWAKPRGWSMKLKGDEADARWLLEMVLDTGGVLPPSAMTRRMRERKAKLRAAKKVQRDLFGKPIKARRGS